MPKTLIVGANVNKSFLALCRVLNLSFITLTYYGRLVNRYHEYPEIKTLFNTRFEKTAELSVIWDAIIIGYNYREYHAQSLHFCYVLVGYGHHTI